MDKVWSIFEGIIDLACFIPPISQIHERWMVSQQVAECVCFVAVGLLGFSIIQGSLRESSLVSGQGIVVTIGALCIALLAFGSLRLSDWRAIFTTSYVAMIMAIRFVEGLLIGNVAHRRPRSFITMVILATAILATVTYFALAAVPEQVVAVLKVVWALGGAVAASIGAANTIEAAFTNLNGSQELRWAAAFAVFLSTLLYVSSSPVTDVVYKSLLPLGLVAGIFAGRLEGRSGLGE